MLWERLEWDELGVNLEFAESWPDGAMHCMEELAREGGSGTKA